MKANYLGALMMISFLSVPVYGINYKLFDQEAEYQFHRVFSREPDLEAGLEASLTKSFLGKDDVVEDDLDARFKSVIHKTQQVGLFQAKGSFDKFTSYCAQLYNKAEYQPQKRFIICELLERVTHKMNLALRRIQEFERQAASQVESTGSDSFPDVFKSFFTPHVETH